MYLSELTITGFRRLDNITIPFRNGLNVIIGPNNAGKTAIVDALRVLLLASDDGSLRLSETDLHKSPDGRRAPQATFTYIFRDLSPDQEADFLTALVPIKNGSPGNPKFEAHLTIQYSKAQEGARLKIKRWVGKHEDNPLTMEMLEELRAIYLPPLRDPAQGLKPGRSSQLSKLIQRLSPSDKRKELENTLTDFDTSLKKQHPVSETQKAISDKHLFMLGKDLAQTLDIGLSPSDFIKFASRLSLSIENFEVEQNGLGFNNLIYMAIVLSELALSKESSYCGLVIEEPEAHLHPQLQSVLLKYLNSVEKPKNNEKSVQVFVTSHSPNFAALADLDSICCVYSSGKTQKAFTPRSINFEPGKKQKLQRYLNVTRAELFFARRIIFVEGTAELFLVEAFAEKLGLDLRKASVSVISIDGLNFDAFLPLFGEAAMHIPVAIITDADPPSEKYPTCADEIELSANASKVRKYQNELIQCFFASKTLEYDIALSKSGRDAMILALRELHPTISAKLETEISALSEEKNKAKELYNGIFNRGTGKSQIKKGEFAQSLSQIITKDNTTIDIPQYLSNALHFISNTTINH